MSEPVRTFRTALRGYDPTEVDRAVKELTSRAEIAHAQVAQLEARVRELEEEREQGEPEVPAEAVSFAHLGTRVGQILALAEDEAREIVDRGRSEISEMQAEAGEAAQAQRDDADHYSTQRRSSADTEAARVLEDARRAADDRTDTADRDAAARMQEAEAVYEDQRAKAAKAAADFETTLAHRRKLAEEEFTVQMEESRGRLVELERHIEQTRTEGEAERSESSREARRLLEDAHAEATEIVSDAKATAGRVRADFERELAAAGQRRDAINAQLANVRQMLATLTGVAPSMVPPDEAGADDADAGEAVELGADESVEADLESTDVSDEPAEADVAAEAEQSDSVR